MKKILISRKKNPNEAISNVARRGFLLLGAQVAFVVFATSRLGYLQILKSEKMSLLSDNNRISRRTLLATRGRILDRFGFPLAANKEDYELYLIPELTKDIRSTLSEINSIVSIGEIKKDEILKLASKQKRFIPILVKSNLSWEEFSLLNANFPNIPGIHPTLGQKRSYPFGESFSHLVGYISNPNTTEVQNNSSLKLPGKKIGRRGLEKVFDAKLRGKLGLAQIEVNALGREVKVISQEDSTQGLDLLTTLDSGTQKFVYNKLKGHQGAAVVLDIRNGGIICSASTPSFDPNQFIDGISQSKWANLLSDPKVSLLNRAVAGEYPPGSIIKILVALSALEHNVINPKLKVYCPGHYDYADRKFYCWKKTGHGYVNLHRAIKESCDTYFYNLSLKLGIEKMANTLKDFGLGSQITDFFVDERSGIVPNKKWKKEKFGKKWVHGETLISAIGQGYMLTTPLQLANVIAQIANNGKEIKPKILISQLKDSRGPSQVLASQRSVNFVKNALFSSTNEPGGTSYSSRLSISEKMAGKTGTAQVRVIDKIERKIGVLKNKELPWKDRDHGLFVAFAPYHAPRFAISVIIEHGGSGSGVPARIARDTMEYLLKNKKFKDEEFEEYA